MLHEVEMTGGYTGKAGFLPFFNNKVELNGVWRVGSKMMQKYYTVYDLTPTDGSLSIGVAPKNPTFTPDTNDGGDGGGGNIPDQVKKHGGVIAAVVIIILSAMVGGACYYKKKRDQ